MESNEKEQTVSSNKKEKNKKLTLAYIGLMMVMVIIFIIAVAIPSGNDDKSGDNTSIKINTYSLNEKVSFDDLEYTFLKLDYDDYCYVDPVYANTYERENENNLMCWIRLNLHNTSLKTKSLEEGWLVKNNKYSYSLYCDDARYNTIFGSGPAFLMNHDSISAKETITVDLVFEVPKDLFNNSVKIYLEFGLNKVNTKVKNRIMLKNIDYIVS